MAITLELHVTSESRQAGSYRYELRSSSGDVAATSYAMHAALTTPEKAFAVGDRVRVDLTPPGKGQG